MSLDWRTKKLTGKADSTLDMRKVHDISCYRITGADCEEPVVYEPGAGCPERYRDFQDARM